MWTGGYDIGQVRSDMESGRSGILYYALRDGFTRRWSTSRWTTTTGTSSRWCPPRRGGRTVDRMVLLAVVVDGAIVLSLPGADPPGEAQLRAASGRSWSSWPSATR